MTRRSLLVSLVAVGAVPRGAFAAQSSDLMAARLELIAQRSRLGESHPRMVALRERAAQLEAAGVKIDPAEAEREFLSLFRRRAELRQNYGLHHPEVLTATRQIGFLATVLAGPAR